MTFPMRGRAKKPKFVPQPPLTGPRLAEANFKITKATTQIVMDHPFVASILLKYPVQLRYDIPSMAVNGRGQIFVNPHFILNLPIPQIVWGLSHEVFHRVGQHVPRMQKRKHKKWNIATDAWINDTLTQAQIGTPIPETVNMPGSAAETCEDIYAKLPDGDGPGGDEGEEGGQPGGNGTSSGSGGNNEGDDGGMGDDLLDEDQPQTESEAAEQAAQNKIDVAEAAQAAKARGKLPGALAKFAADIIESKTPWYDILERHLVGFTKGDYSWKRPNKRYDMLDMYLPTVGVVPKMGTVVLQVDISGSVSRQEIKHYNGHIKRIIEQCQPEKVYVVYTDTCVHHVDEYEAGEEIEIGYYSGGGTDMRAGFNWIDKEGIDPDVVVTLTDGYTPFPDSTNYPSVWCISSEIVSPIGDTVHFEMTEK